MGWRGIMWDVEYLRCRAARCGVVRCDAGALLCRASASAVRCGAVAVRAGAVLCSALLVRCGAVPVRCRCRVGAVSVPVPLRCGAGAEPVPLRCHWLRSSAPNLTIPKPHRQNFHLLQTAQLLQRLTLFAARNAAMRSAVLTTYYWHEVRSTHYSIAMR